jgi:D-galactarolactone cycloisomerase
MKLTSIAAAVVYPPKPGVQGIPLIEIQTDSGLTGWGEAQASRSPDAVCDIARDLLVPALENWSFRGGRSEIESLWDGMYALMRHEGQTGGFMLEAICAVDMALWDLDGQARRQPVYQLAGNPSVVAEVQSFVSLPTCRAVMPTLQSLRNAGVDLIELAYDRGEADLIAALDCAKAALEGAGRVAVNARWRLNSGWDLCFERQFDQRDLLWLANPLPPEDPFAHGRLSKVLCTPLALGETWHSHYELAPFLHEMAVGVLQLDLGRCGLTEAFRMAEMAQCHGIPVVVRVGESLGPQLAAALQFAAAAAGRRVEYGGELLKTANSALGRPVEWKQGKYRVPDAPGLGIEVVEAEIHLMETQAA